MTEHGLIEKSMVWERIDFLIKASKKFGGKIFAQLPIPGKERASFSGNIQEIVTKYPLTFGHPITGKPFSFKDTPNTTDTINLLAYSLSNPDLNQYLAELINEYEIQLGWIVKTSEGIYVNPPRHKEKITRLFKSIMVGDPVMDEEILKKYRDMSQNEGGIWLLENGKVEGVENFGFAPYESFTIGRQSREKFLSNPKTNGLARLIEHSVGKPFALKTLTSRKYFPENLEVTMWSPQNYPESKVLCFTRIKNEEEKGSVRFFLEGDQYFKGYTFGEVVERPEVE